MRYSIVIATYNAEEHLESLIQELIEIFLRKERSFEIIFVNDASGDGTQRILEKYSRKYNQIRVLELTKNSGQQIAFSAGIENTNGDVVILLDDDMIDLIRPIEDVLNPILSGEFDIAIGTTTPNGVVRRLTSKLFWKIMARVSNQVIKNRELTLRCFNKEVASNYKLYKEKYRSVTEIMLDLGYRRTYVEVSNIQFRKIKSRHNFHKRFRLFIQILSTSRQNSGMGLMYFSFFSLLMLPISVVTLYYLGFIAFEDRVALVLAIMIWFSFSSTAFLFGIVLFIISMLLRETQQRPLYHLKKSLEVTR
jgi:glycosyltransferase involved in cell wall biosynthesis